MPPRQGQHTASSSGLRPHQSLFQNRWSILSGTGYFLIRTKHNIRPKVGRGDVGGVIFLQIRCCLTSTSPSHQMTPPVVVPSGPPTSGPAAGELCPVATPSSPTPSTDSLSDCMTPFLTSCVRQDQSCA